MFFFFFGNSRNRLKYSKQFFVSCNRYVKGLKKIYLFQDTVKTIWNTSNYYILISDAHSEEAGPHLSILKRKKSN